MKHTKLVKIAGLVAVLALLAAACSSGSSSSTSTTASTSQAGVKGGTLRIDDQGDVDYLDSADAYYTVSWGLMRLYERQLFSWNSSMPGSSINDPVPDLATSYTVNSNKTVWTFTIRPNVMYAPPVSRPIVAQDFITAVERMYNKATPSGGQTYSNLIVGAANFAAGKANTISGLKAINSTTIQFSLVHPTADFLSIVALPFFSPVPASYADKWPVGATYSLHTIGAGGPYVLQKYIPGKSIVFVRNTNWNPATDPLRKAWVNKIVVTEGFTQQAIQQLIETDAADITLDSQPPVADLQNLSTNPTLSKQFSDNVTGCVRYLELETNPAAGPIGKGHSGLLIRQAINYALNKIAIQRVRGGPLAGEPASTILPPVLNAYVPYNLYPSPNNEGDPAMAKTLLKEAGYPNGLTLSFVGPSDDPGPATITVIQAALALAGIKLSPINTYSGAAVYTDNLSIPAKRTLHEVGIAGWCPDYPGNGARSFMVPLLYGPSIFPTGNNNYMEFNDPTENNYINQALSAPSIDRQNALWSLADKYAMEQAVWAPYLYDKLPSFWSSRTHNWIFSPWTTTPDLTALWLNPNTP